MSRILIYEPRQTPADDPALLAGLGLEVVVSRTPETLFESLAERRPDALVYVLGDLTLDLASLWALRRVAPNLPIILLGGPAELEDRRSVQELKPTYYGVFPLEPSELADAVRGALSHRARARAS